MLTAVQRSQFEQDGIVKVEAAFSQAEAARMRDVLWANITRRFGFERDDPSTWDGAAPSGFQSLRRHRAFAPTQGPDWTDALDDLIGPGQWTLPKHYGQFLVTFPNAGAWQVPHAIWHADFSYTLPEDQLAAVKYWVLLGDLEPGGGGTPQLAGSHRLMRHYLGTRDPADREYKSVRDGFMRWHPWLKELKSPADMPDRTKRFMEDGVEIEGISLKVVELCGRAGDIFFTHPWVMHTVAVNARQHPRLMRTMAVYRNGVRDAGPEAEQESA